MDARGGATVRAPSGPRLLLATSGSTGRPRLVRQAERSVQASAAAICAALQIDENQVAITALPLYYTLGLSVLHSHLRAGATVVVESRGVLDRGFWDSVDRYGVTSITGVPHTYELLIRQPWRPTDNPSVRRLCVSGARIRDKVAMHFHEEMQRHGGAFYVMYGQTEAGSRICVLPPEHLPAKLGSVGPPIPGTRLSIESAGPDGVGEVVCHSDTVMMGYAEDAADLARGDDLAGVWPTGDHGRLDSDGYLWLSGRASRIGKAYGVRVSLDAVEHVCSAIAPTAAVAATTASCCGARASAPTGWPRSPRWSPRNCEFHRTAVIVSAVPELPRRPNGKVNYDALPVYPTTVAPAAEPADATEAPPYEAPRTEAEEPLRRCSPRCSSSSGWACTMTCSSAAATRCTRSRSSAGSTMLPASMSRSVSSSSTRPWAS